MINHPVSVHSREFMVSHTDTKMAFQKLMIKNMRKNRTKERVFELARRFLQEGRIDENEYSYQALDKQITQAALAAAKKVGQRKYGYMRNGKLTICGRMVIH